MGVFYGRVFRLFGYFQAHCFRDAFAISGICFRAMSDMPQFDLFGYAVHVAGGIFKQHLLLLGAHQAEQVARLCEVIGLCFPEVEAIRIPLQREWRLGEVWLFLPFTVAVWLVVQARSEEHTSELQSRPHLVCRLLLE